MTTYTITYEGPVTEIATDRFDGRRFQVEVESAALVVREVSTRALVRAYGVKTWLTVEASDD